MNLLAAGFDLSSRDVRLSASVEGNVCQGGFQFEISFYPSLGRVSSSLQVVVACKVGNFAETY